MQALHILRKDAWRLRFEIAIVLALTCLFTVANVRDAHTWWQKPPMWPVDNPFQILLCFAWAFLCGRLIQSEALPGNRQFWLTRPYARWSLLGAKLLFAVIFINLPMLISDLVTVSANGFAPREHIAGFFAKQMLLACEIEAPLLAVAAVTRQAGELVLNWLVLGFLGLIFGMFFNGFRAGRGHFATGSLDWFQSAIPWAVIAVAATLMLVLQFFKRSTRLSQAIGLGGLVCAGMIFALERPGFGAPVLSLGPDKGSGYEMKFCGYPNCQLIVRRDNQTADLELPVHLTGSLQGSPSIDNATLTITAKGAKVSYHAWGINSMQADVDGETRVFPLVSFDVPQFDSIKNYPVTLELSVSWSIWGTRSVVSVPNNGPPVRVPDLGVCAFMASTLQCRCAFEWPRRRLTAQSYGVIGMAAPNYSPIPAESPLDPIARTLTTMVNQQADEMVSAETPLATFRRMLTFRDLRLSDYER